VLAKLPFFEERETTNQTNCTNEETSVNAKETILFKDESYRIIGACFEVYNELGSGFLEAVYQEALTLKFREQKLPYLDQHTLRLRYKSYQLQTPFKPDFICFDKVILEIKAVSRLTDEHRAQIHNYLKATDFRLGLLVNFGQHPKVIYERIVR
jgi:GxxExxY protein